MATGAIATRKAAEVGYCLARLRVLVCASALSTVLKGGFRPDQPRVPHGNPDGGQWTRVPGWAAGRNRADRNARRRDSVLPVSGRARNRGGQVRIGGRLLDATPAQQTRLAVTQLEMNNLLHAVARVDPSWKPRPQLFESVEGQIEANIAIAIQARLRLQEIARERFGPGPFESDWIAAPNTNRRLTKTEQEEINRIGRKWGCHTCGSRDPHTRSDNFVGDHQVPRSIGEPTRILPHCYYCSSTQGGIVRGYLRRRK